MRAVSSMMASSSKCPFSRSIKCSSIASDRSVTASAYSSATRSRLLNRALCCQTSSTSTLPTGTPRFRSVAELISTQKRQPLSWDTRTVTSDRNPVIQRRIFPVDHAIKKRDSQKDFWGARPEQRGVEYGSIFVALIPKEWPEIPRTGICRFGRKFS